MATNDRADQPPDNSGPWDANRALFNLTMDNAIGTITSPEDMARKLFKENLPIAVMAICHMAIHSDTEMMRFQAAKFVVERTMGPAERVVPIEGRHAWDDIYDTVTQEAEGYLRK